MKYFILAVILIMFCLPAFADDCGRFVMKKAVINDVPIYRVMDGEEILIETSNLFWARYKLENAKNSCEARNDADEWFKKLETAKWEVIE
jgi:hypothetical protein